MNADPEVMEYFPKILNEEESNDTARKFSSLIAQQSWGFWAVETRDKNEFIGFVGLNKPDYELPVSSCTEIGWRLAKEFWGKGYATEAAKEVLRFAFEELSLSEVYSFTVTSNEKSRAVMQRINMLNTSNNFQHPLIAKGHPLREHVLYKLSSEQWKK